MKPALSLVIAMLVGIATSGFALAAPRYDYCAMYPDVRPTLVVIDRTEPFDRLDRELVSAAMGRIFKEAVAGTRLIIHTMTEDFSTSAMVFDGCVPGCPDSDSLSSAILSECSAIVARRDTAEFRKRLADSLLALLDTSEEHGGSAIVETLAALGSQYRGIGRLIVYSDLLENTDLARFDRIDGKSLAGLLPKLAGLHLIPALDGADVIAFGFGRAQGPDRPGLTPAALDAIRTFWIAYFGAAGAASTRIAQRYE